MEVGVQLVFMLIFGGISAAIASSKGRSGIGWFFGGFFLGLIGLIIVAVLPNLKDVEAKRRQDRTERHRLREQLRQERMKSEAYRRHTAARLDAHDDHLGVDTRGLGALPDGHGEEGLPHELGTGAEDPLSAAVGSRSGTGRAAPMSAFVDPVAGAPKVKEWFYELRGESRGPVSEAAIRTGLAGGRIDGETLVWREGMPTWQALAEVPLFATSFRG